MNLKSNWCFSPNIKVPGEEEMVKKREMVPDWWCGLLSRCRHSLHGTERPPARMGRLWKRLKVSNFVIYFLQIFISLFIWIFFFCCCSPAGRMGRLWKRLKVSPDLSQWEYWLYFLTVCCNVIIRYQAIVKLDLFSLDVYLGMAQFDNQGYLLLSSCR